MKKQDIHERINEFKKIKPDGAADNLSLLEMALFVEQVFGLCLTDDDICVENLGTHQATEQFVIRKLGAL